MLPPPGTLHWLTATMLITFSGFVLAQAPGVPIMRDRGDPARTLIQAANAAREANQLLPLAQVAAQMARRQFTVNLPEPHNIPLHSRALWARGRTAHVRVGWHYLCKRCDKWHQSLAGGFFLNAYGLVATCQHVIDPATRNYREGYLVAFGDDGTLYPVVEVLASHPATDVAILRVAVDKPVPYLPLNENVYPGDDAWCYSYPLRRAGYFSHGIVNRFHYEDKDGGEVARLAVTTDWAPGSSGSAIVDAYGNAIGIVSTISPAGTGRSQPRNRLLQNFVSPQSDPTVIIFRTAARAADIRALIGPESPLPPPAAEEGETATHGDEDEGEPAPGKPEEKAPPEGEDDRPENPAECP